MSLSGRLSAFFLTALAAVLAGFSCSLIGLAWISGVRRLDDRLAASLETLAAAAEVKRHAVEWDPRERRILLGLSDSLDEPRWIVADRSGRIIERSPNQHGKGLDSLWAVELDDRVRPRRVHDLNGRGWRRLSRRIAPQVRRPRRRGEVDEHEPEYNEKFFSELILSAAVPIWPLDASLRELGRLLGGLSIAIWVAAALLGRKLGRRALAPLSRMAERARAMRADDLDERLPCPASKDELEDLGRAFNGLLSRLQEAFERQRRFTGDASHQLRTPLTALLGQIEVAERRERSPEEYQRVLKLVHAEASRLRQIVEALLFLARADAEARLPGLNPVDLAERLEAAIERWSNHPRAADLSLEFSIKDRVVVEAHPPLFDQLIDNLIENAFKYTNVGDRVRLILDRDDRSAIVKLVDSGPGVSEFDLAHVFEPFYRSRSGSVAVKSGVGLGLAVAKRIAVAHGGSIEARATPVRGATFEVRLPLPGDLDETDPVSADRLAVATSDEN